MKREKAKKLSISRETLLTVKGAIETTGGSCRYGCTFNCTGPTVCYTYQTQCKSCWHTDCCLIEP